MRTPEKKKKWTKFILAFLRQWGEDNGYEVQREKPTNLDMVWRREGKDIVAIEHENNGDNYCKNEISNLLSLGRAKERVLITYLNENQYGDQFEKLKNSVNEELQKLGAQNFTFWLIVGPWHIGDPLQFACVKFSPQFVGSIVVPAKIKW